MDDKRDDRHDERRNRDGDAEPLQSQPERPERLILMLDPFPLNEHEPLHRRFHRVQPVTSTHRLCPHIRNV